MPVGPDDPATRSRRRSAGSIPDHRTGGWRAHRLRLSRGRVLQPAGNASGAARGLRRGLHRSDHGLQNGPAAIARRYSRGMSHRHFPYVFLAAWLLIAVGPALAADVTGTWTAAIDTQIGV